MIVLDTNVISELMKANADMHVLHWANSFDFEQLCTTAITAAELLSGTEQLPPGKKRDRLSASLSAVLMQGFYARVLPFDESCAPHLARIYAHRRAIGRCINEPDAMIAAICSRHGYKVATRDVSDFVQCDIEVIDPWTA
jgi:predicted nucleic acid-binding protein